MNEDDSDVDIWCDSDDYHASKCVREVDECDCVACLRMLGSVGAHAAMRCVALEQGSDARETAAERDKAIEELKKTQKALAHRNLFVCGGCYLLKPDSEAALVVGTMAWCAVCTKVTT
jgi:hypothetical protein